MSPDFILFLGGGKYQFLLYFYETFSAYFLTLVSALNFPILRTMMSGGFRPYFCLWHGDYPAECTVAFHTLGGMIILLGLGALPPQPIQISYYLQDMFLKVFFGERSPNIISIIDNKSTPHPIFTHHNPPSHLRTCTTMTTTTKTLFFRQQPTLVGCIPGRGGGLILQ